MCEKYTLITGVTSDIGKGIAIKLSRKYNLILHGRNIDKLRIVKNNCSNNTNHIIWSFDLSHTSNLSENLKGFLLSNNVKVDCFIHVAGIFKIFPMYYMDYKTAQEMLNVNFLSASEIIRILLSKRINKLNLKNIIFISSIASRFGVKGLNIYCASKGALNSFMRALAVELAPNIRVNSILPGAIKTRTTEEVFNDDYFIKKYKRDYLLGRGGIEDIVNMVEFIISKDAKWITGQELVVDGGKTCH